MPQATGSRPTSPSTTPTMTLSNSNLHDIRPATRSCAQCRARKVKCDRCRTGCAPCQRLDMACSYVGGAVPAASVNTASHEITQAGTKRKRILKACRSCHAQRTKCSGRFPCERCQSLGIHCLERPSRRFPSTADDVDTEPAVAPIVEMPVSNPASPSTLRDTTAFYVTPPTPRQPILHDSASQTAILELSPTLYEQSIHFSGLSNGGIRCYLEVYFRHQDPLHCIFLHKATFMNEWQHGRLDETFLKMITAFGFKLTNPTNTIPDAWVKEVESVVLSRYSDMSMTQLRTIVVLLHYSLHYGRFDSTWMLLGIAARLAFSKRLNYEIPCNDVISQESSRRLMWSIFLIDKMIGGGMVDMSVCPANRMHLNLPGNEHCFTYGIAAKPHPLKRHEGEESTDMGYLAFKIRMGDIRDRVLSYTKGVIRSGIAPHRSESALHALTEELRVFRQCLPAELALSTQNIILHSHTPHFTGYLTLHTHWYQSHCDLYRFVIPGIRESVAPPILAETPQEYIGRCQRKCLDAAIAELNLWAHLPSFNIPKPLDHSTFGVCAYQCFKIIQKLRHLLPDEGEESVSSLVNKMWQVFDMLQRVRDNYPIIERCMNDIEQIILEVGAGFSFHSRENSRPPPNPPTFPKESRYSFIPPLRDDRSDYSSSHALLTEQLASVSSSTQSTSDTTAHTEITTKNTQLQSAQTLSTSSNIINASAVATGPGYESRYAPDAMSLMEFDHEVDSLLDPFDLRFNPYSGFNSSLPGFSDA